MTHHGWVRAYEQGLAGLELLCRALPLPSAGCTVLPSLRYGPHMGRAHCLDWYLPIHAPAPWPVVVYFHGGGFTACSKDTHRRMGRRLANQGFAAALINYRLAPKYPCPAAVADAVLALHYVARMAPTYGADPMRMVLAGESAGANLALNLVRGLVDPEDMPALAAVPAAPCRVVGVAALCGLLQVSQPERYAERAPPTTVARLERMAHAYLDAAEHGSKAYADPLTWIERVQPSPLDLPPWFVGVGANDSVKWDSDRLVTALHGHHANVEEHTYPGMGHAFFLFRRGPAVEALYADLGRFIHRQAGRASGRQA